MNNKINLEFLLRVLQLTANISYSSALWWRTDGIYAPVSIFINCNNKFEAGRADCECLTPDNLYLFEEAIEEIKEVGGNEEFAPLLFCAKLKRTRPLDSAYPGDNRLWHLFDRIGLNMGGDINDRPIDIPFHQEAESGPSWWQRLMDFVQKILNTILGWVNLK